MQTKIKLLLFATLHSQLLIAQPREVTSLDFGWKFSRDSSFAVTENVDLPHDFQISQPWTAPAPDEMEDHSDAAANRKSSLSARAFKEMGEGWYRRTIDTEELNITDNDRLLIDFEGIMLVGDVYLNGERIGGTDYGFVGFEIDITQKLQRGANSLVVKASTMEADNSRWYTGGGLFRGVSLVKTAKDIHLARHPLRIVTRDNRFVDISVEVFDGTKQRKALVETKIYDPDGVLVWQHADSIRRIGPAHSFETRLTSATVTNPRLWDTDHPNLYHLEVTLLRPDGTVADEYSEQFGIRTVEFDPSFGMKLNGKKVLLKGFANHNNLGALGAAAYPRAAERLLRMMKQFGVNHVRTSHNPYSRGFIRLCDKLGILVVDELYDKWTQQYAGGRSPFMSHWMYDVEEWVRRDRNSPSVVLWSLGNETQHRTDMPFNDYGVTCYKMMKTMVSRHDSTRLTTVAMHPRYRNWQTDSLPCDLAMHTDIQSYNYRYKYFPGDGRRFPWMTFYQSEASIGLMGPNFFEMDHDKAVGLAYWGVIDYLGESRGWPAKGWDNGVFDISLQPKPKAYLMKTLYSDAPVVHVSVMEYKGTTTQWNGVDVVSDEQNENWNRTEGSEVDVVVYTNCDEVELMLNGKSIGRKPNPSDATHRNTIKWEGIAYQKGQLQAVAFREGKVVARHELQTTGKAVRLVAIPENDHWIADGKDLQHVRIMAVDSCGRCVRTCQEPLTFEVEGDARIVAVSNGDIRSDESYTGNSRHLWNGKALVILRAGKQPSKVALRIRGARSEKRGMRIVLSLISKN